MLKQLSLILMLALCSISVSANPEVIINNNATGNSGATNCPPANQNNIYDPRVPPAGVYSSQNNGVFSTDYTTGEKKPYLTQNGCDNNTVVPPYVMTPPIQSE